MDYFDMLDYEEEEIEDIDSNNQKALSLFDDADFDERTNNPGTFIDYSDESDDCNLSTKALPSYTNNVNSSSISVNNNEFEIDNEEDLTVILSDQDDEDTNQQEDREELITLMIPEEDLQQLDDLNYEYSNNQNENETDIMDYTNLILKTDQIDHQTYINNIIEKFKEIPDDKFKSKYLEFTTHLLLQGRYKNFNLWLNCLRCISISLILHFNMLSNSKKVISILNILLEKKIKFGLELTDDFIRAVIKTCLDERDILKLLSFFELEEYFDAKKFQFNISYQQITFLSNAYDEINKYISNKFNILKPDMQIYLPTSLINLIIDLYLLIKQFGNNKRSSHLTEQVFINFSNNSKNILQYILCNRRLEFTVKIISSYITKKVFHEAIGSNWDLLRNIVCYIVERSKMNKTYFNLLYQILDIGIELGIYPIMKPFAEEYVNNLHFQAAAFPSEVSIILQRFILTVEDFFKNHKEVPFVNWKIKIIGCQNYRYFIFNVLKPILSDYSLLKCEFESNDSIIAITQRNQLLKNIYKRSISVDVSSLNNKSITSQNNIKTPFISEEDVTECYTLNEFQDRNYRDISLNKNISSQLNDRLSQNNCKLIKSSLLPTPIFGFERVGLSKNTHQSNNGYHVTINKDLEPPQIKNQVTEKYNHINQSAIQNTTFNINNTTVNHFKFNKNNKVYDHKYYQSNKPVHKNVNKFKRHSFNSNISNSVQINAKNNNECIFDNLGFSKNLNNFQTRPFHNNNYLQPFRQTEFQLSSLEEKKVHQDVHTRVHFHIANGNQSISHAQLLIDNIANQYLDHLYFLKQNYNILAFEELQLFVDNQLKSGHTAVSKISQNSIFSQRYSIN